MTTPLDDIRKLYFAATAATIAADFDRAIDLVKAIASEEERGRAVVYMEGLAEMKQQWVRSKPAGGKAGRSHRPPKPAKRPPTRR
jgi:hypothetical protein